MFTYYNYVDEKLEYVKQKISNYIKDNIKCNYFIMDGEIVEDFDVIDRCSDYIYEEFNIDWENDDYRDLPLAIECFFDEPKIAPLKDNMLDLIEKFENVRGVLV